MSLRLIHGRLHEPGSIFSCGAMFLMAVLLGLLLLFALIYLTAW